MSRSEEDQPAFAPALPDSKGSVRHEQNGAPINVQGGLMTALFRRAVEVWCGFRNHHGHLEHFTGYTECQRCWRVWNNP